MDIITKSLFTTLPYSIPGIVESNDFDNVAKTYVDAILIELMGNRLFKAFETAVDTPPTDPRWLKLLNGFEYKIDNKPYVWGGMVSMLQPYIYYKSVVDTYNTLTNVGFIESKTENAAVISPRVLCEHYNTFVDRAGAGFCQINSLYGFLLTSGSTYLTDVGPEFSSIEEYVYEYGKNLDHLNIFGL